MHALSRGALLALAAQACSGPTLYVGELVSSKLDADTPAAPVTVDAGEDAQVVVRDAQVSDARADSGVVVERCLGDDDCRDPRRPVCNTNFFACTGCQYDRDCRQSEYCDGSPFVWVCRDGPHKDDPGSTSTGGAP